MASSPQWNGSWSARPSIGGPAANNAEEAAGASGRSGVVTEKQAAGPWGSPGVAAEKQALLVRGAMGPDARLINGLYDLKVPGLDPVFRARRIPGRKAMGEFDKAGIWLYRAKNGTWCVSNAESKDARSTTCWAYKTGDLLRSAGSWQVAVGDGWEAQQLGLQPLSARMTATLIRDLSDRATAWRATHPSVEVVALPYDSLSWTPQECDIWFLTGGLLHPRERADRYKQAARYCRTDSSAKRKRVSVVTPTTESRQSFHQKLWACFEAQDWPDKELIVVETYQQQSSAFFTALAGTDPRLTYVAYPVPAEKDWSIGLKRNICVHFSSGEYIVHFDDDDLYAANYVPSMIRAVVPATLGAKLSTWYVFDRASNSFGFCDPEQCGREQQLHEDLVRQRVYGYGFSYVFRREAFLRLQFEDVNFGEDFRFLWGLRCLEGSDCIGLVKDETGLCMHTQHGHNTSETNCVMLRTLQWDQVCDLDFADLPLVFDSHLQSFGRAEEKRQLHHGPAPRQLGRRIREVVVHSPVGALRLRLPAGALGEDVLAKVEDRLGDLPTGTQILWIPLVWEVSEAEHERTVQQAIRNLLPGVVKPGSVPTAEQAELLVRISGAVPPHSRIGARTSELWLSVPGPWSLEGDTARGQELRLKASRTNPSVRVCCDELPSRESVSRVFHVDMPMDATVGYLRWALGSRLPEWAEVLVRRPGRGRVALGDQEPLPDKVALSDFSGTVTPEMMLTKQLCRDFMAELLRSVKTARVQQALDGFQEEARGDEGMYRAKLAFLLLDEIYPDAACRFGLSRSTPCMRALKETITVLMQGDVEMYAIAVELESSLRNWVPAESNAAILRQLLLDREAHEAAAMAAAAAAAAATVLDTRA